MVRQTMIALAVGSALTGMAAQAQAAEQPPATQPTTAELLQQIQQLQARVEQMEARQNQNSAEVAATVDAIVKDAEKRSQALDSIPLVGNWQDGKFILRSDDGNYLLHPWLQLQLRDTTNYRDNPGNNGGSDFENGFELRRMKFGFDGNVFSPDTTYFFNWGTNRSGGAVTLEEAWVKQKLNDNWSILGGQFKDPFAHESLIGSSKLMAAERTLLTDVFTGGDNYVQGVSAIWSHDDLAVQGAFTDGANSFNNNFLDFPSNDWDFGVAARVQYKVFGDWGDYGQFTSLNDKKDLLVVGGGVDWSQGGNTDQVLQTVDVQYNQTSGLGLYGALYGRFTGNAPKGVNGNLTVVTPQSDAYDWGFVGQVSYLIPNTRWEPFGRYDYIHFDSIFVPVGGTEDVNEITAGINYYLHGQNAKFTLDISYLPDGSPVSDSSADIISGAGAEFLLRGQFQLML